MRKPDQDVIVFQKQMTTLIEQKQQSQEQQLRFDLGPDGENLQRNLSWKLKITGQKIRSTLHMKFKCGAFSVASRDKNFLYRRRRERASYP